jgi:flagella basal body P-ring formation protein FlgA
MKVLFFLLFSLLFQAAQATQEKTVSEPSLSTQKSDIEAELEHRIRDLIASVYKGETYRFEVIAKRIPSQLEDVGVQLLAVRQLNPGLPKGYTVFDVDYSVSGSKRIAKVQFNIKVMQLLPVPLNRIMTGEPLHESQFTQQWVDITNLRGEIIENAKDVNNRVASGMLRDGYPIRPTDLSLPPIVEAGSSLTMYFEQNGIQLALPVISRVSATKGEVINVWCETTRKTYRARVASSNMVQWEQTL